MTSYAIVGGGMLGLKLALDLTDLGHEVSVFEGSDHIGGLASSWQLGDVRWDRFYHVTLESDTHTQKLLRRLDISTRSVRAETGVYADGELFALTTNLDFLRFPILSLVDKFRFGLTILRAAYSNNWEQFEQMPVETWLTRWSGKRVFNRFWLPLLRSKLGDSYRDTSAAFIWATIQRLYKARSESGNQERFGYIPGGYQSVLERLANLLSTSGATINLGTSVEQISSAEDKIQLKLVDGRVEAFDNVIVTAAAPLAARLCPDLPDVERQSLSSLPYLGVVCASVLLDQPLSPYYVTNLVDPAPFTGVIEMSNLVDSDELGGKHLVYLPKYVTPDDPLFSASDEEICEEFIAGLGKIHPQMGEVVTCQIARARYVMAIPTISFSERVPGFRSSVTGLSFVNSAQIVNGTLNVNETLALAERALTELALTELT